MKRTSLMRAPKTRWHFSYTVYFKNRDNRIYGDNIFATLDKSCSSTTVKEIRDWITLTVTNNGYCDEPVQTVVLNSLTKLS